MTEIALSRAAPRIGRLPRGARDAATDVPGVQVGHCTLTDGDVQTGVTVVLPHEGDLYRDRVPAAGVVLNGFGKSVGPMQVEELGGVRDADRPDQPLRRTSRGRRSDPCGIGTASRRVRTKLRGRFTLGTFVLSNFGKRSQLRIGGTPLAAHFTEAAADPESVSEPPEKDSIIMAVATDAPLDARHLRRLALRAGAGLARIGSVYGHGSGDIALAFTTAYTLPQDPARAMPVPALLHDAEVDPLFETTADGIEQAIVHALLRAETVTSRDGHRRHALTDLLPDWADLLETRPKPVRIAIDSRGRRRRSHRVQTIPAPLRTVYAGTPAARRCQSS